MYIFVMLFIGLVYLVGSIMMAHYLAYELNKQFGPPKDAADYALNGFLIFFASLLWPILAFFWWFGWISNRHQK